MVIYVILRFTATNVGKHLLSALVKVRKDVLRSLTTQTSDQYDELMSRLRELNKDLQDADSALKQWQAQNESPWSATQEEEQNQLWYAILDVNRRWRTRICAWLLWMTD